MLVFIAESTTGDKGVGNDDITTFLKSLLIPTLLEISPVEGTILESGKPPICCGRSRTQKRLHPVDAYFMIKDEIKTR